MTNNEMLKLTQALHEASVYGIGATSDVNQRVILEAAKAFAAAASAEPVAWRSRMNGASLWDYFESEPRGPSSHLFETSPLYTHPAPDAEIVATDEMVEAAARELWNDRDARMGGSWDSRDPQEVCVIQTKATARAMLKAALTRAKGGSQT